MDHDLIGYLLQIDDPDARAQVEAALRDDPDLARRLAALTVAVDPLEADRAIPEPPPGLVTRTIGRVAQHVVETNGAPSSAVDGPPVGEMLARMTPERLRQLVEVMDRSAGPPSRRRPDVFVVASLAVLALGLLLAAVPYWRHRQNVAACQNQMRDFHLALNTYSETHEGRFPQVGDAAHPTAGSFMPLLREAGVLPAKGNLACPAADSSAAVYAYTLGYRDQSGELHGLRRDPNAPTNDLLPILADRPPAARVGAGPDHQTGQNVLFVGGHVAFCTSTNVGVNGDEIYRNWNSKVAAGLHPFDTALGYDTDVP
jgi:prepilin-type processing-associated H-X9-DG protein